MSLKLPLPVELYVRIENAGETDALSTCFADNATVRDEGRTYQGLDAIKNGKPKLKRDTAIPFTH
jgi:hypothetical protein